MTDPSTAVIDKLARATARRAGNSRGGTVALPEAPAPQAPPKRPALPADAAAPDGTPAAGNGTAKYLLLDHYFGGSSGTFWTFDGTTWRAASTGEPADEQGLSQVAFASNRVDMWWDANDSVTVVRCWKYLS